MLKLWLPSSILSRIKEATNAPRHREDDNLVSIIIHILLLSPKLSSEPHEDFWINWQTPSDTYCRASGVSFVGRIGRSAQVL
jgi:hypothetical protein